MKIKSRLGKILNKNFSFNLNELLSVNMALRAFQSLDDVCLTSALQFEFCLILKYSITWPHTVDIHVYVWAYIMSLPETCLETYHSKTNQFGQFMKCYNKTHHQNSGRIVKGKTIA